MTVRTLAGCVTAPRPCGRDRGRRRASRAVRFAAITAALAAVGLAVGAAWGGENGLVVLPVEPGPEVIAVYPEYRWPIVKVIDGDTIKVDARADFPPELARLHVRLRGVDTPEKGGRAKCEAERHAGRAAAAFTTAMASSVILHHPIVGVRRPHPAYGIVKKPARVKPPPRPSKPPRRPRTCARLLRAAASSRAACL